MSTIHVSRSGWLVLGGVLLLPWLVLLWVLWPGHVARRATPSATSPTPAANGKPGYKLGPVGPWGQLQTTRILLEPPEDYIPPYYITAQPLRWLFKGFSAATLDQLLQNSGLSPAALAALQDPRHRTATGDGIVVSPPAGIVVDLPPETRARLYAVLAQFPENLPQHSPFRSRVESVDDWFADTPIPAEIVALTRRLLYRRGPNMMLSDQDLVLPRLPEAALRLAYVKTLSRKSSLLAELLVPPRADVEALARYWGHGRRSKDLSSILDSLAQRPTGGSIDVIHLLPPFARSLLYTYPQPSGEQRDSSRDCHWTSFNFFRDQPDERFTDITFTQQTIQRDYFLCSSPPQMGDIVMLVGKGEQGLHSCVYVADDIVFTKNGPSFSVPWLLARLEDVVAVYTLGEPLEVRRFRAR